ncbi:DUF6318 family protein [Pseudarthrobacter sp. SSS035]|uniref:DUF6318 family protein n=1 Tax=Pseudarthrobacter sp. SSS035 TaxID=2931399 RepID=UPI00200EF778|nr:DUF6318 family protein [Pseudarthrobacter sp. SSS035]
MTSHITSTTSRPSRLHFVAAVAASVLLLTGCNAGGDPGGTSSASPTSTASPSATPAPTPTPAYVPASASGRAQNVPVPVLPEVAKTETKEGLEAFAAYWFQLLSYGYETGDTAQISAITSSDCTMCERAKEVQQGWHSDGRWLEGGRVNTPAVTTNFRVSADGNYQVAVQVSQEAVSYHNVDGSVDSSDPKMADSGSLMLVVFKNGSWFVNTIEPIVG